MMQQVATKRSDVAALPIEIDVTQSQGGAGSQFNEALTLAGEAAKREKEIKGKTTPIRPDPDSVDKQPAAQQHSDGAAASAVEHSSKQLPRAGDTKAAKESATRTDKQAENAEPQVEQTDWLALVESIKEFNESGDSGELQKAISDFIDGEQELTSDLGVSFEQLMEQLAGQNSGKSDGSSLSGELTENDKLASIVEALLTLVTAEGKAEETANSAASPDAMAMAAALLAAMGIKPDGESGPASKDAESALTALTDLADGLTAQHVEGVGSIANQEAESGEADAELLLNLLKSELTGKGEDGKPSENGAVSPGGLVGSSQQSDPLMASMQQLNDESKLQVAEALAEKVVALLPADATEQQQQSVKGAVIAGVKEIQSQLAQGREPGINLQDLIASAVSEADMTLTQQMKAGIDQQLSQLNLVVQTTQHTLAHAQEVTRLTSADTAIQENMQLRSEASKAQQAAEGMDKPVNILKADGQQQLGEKIRWMVNARNSFAEIRLDPPEMGSMQVRVNVAGDTATVSFIVQSAQAKEALADATPRLRDMLAEQGIELGESFVQQESRQGEGNSAEGELAGGHGGGQSADDEDITVVEQTLSRNALGGIDDYA